MYKKAVVSLIPIFFSVKKEEILNFIIDFIEPLESPDYVSNQVAFIIKILVLGHEPD